MGERLRGRNAVVTGAGRGIGREVALALAEEGANIVVCDLGCTTDGKEADKTPADAVVEECQSFGVKAVAHYGDVADFKAAEYMVKTCVDNFGRIDILCNIAGINIVERKMIFDITEEEWDRVVAVHLKGTFNLTKHATPLMRQQRYGRIINCTSQAYAGGVSTANYAAAKGGIVSLTYNTAKEMGGYGVTCNAFAPQARTRLSTAAQIAMLKAGLITQKWLAKANTEFPDASYFAPFIAYLASDAAANINGCIFLAAGTTLGIWNQPEIVRQVPRDWKKEGRWPFEEIEKLVPEKLLVGYVNPAPPGVAFKFRLAT
jgi:NAD(P)-dependent dehydrogenase (short-subunit alcohol dehydrogenase family)